MTAHTSLETVRSGKFEKFTDEELLQMEASLTAFKGSAPGETHHCDSAIAKIQDELDRRKSSK